MLWPTILGFVAGLILGSFIATLVLRWPNGDTPFRGRSRCDDCGTPIAAIDLIPLFGFARLRGRGRCCGGRIDRRHPLIEIGTGLIGAASFGLTPDLATGVAGLVFGAMLMALAILDLDHFWLPDALTLPLLLLGIAAAPLIGGVAIEDRLIAAVAGYLALVAIGWGYRMARGRQGLGGGDPKLLAAIGAWLGWQTLPWVLLLASCAGLLHVGLSALGGRKVVATDRLPLGTLLAAAAWPLWLYAATAG